MSDYPSQDNNNQGTERKREEGWDGPEPPQSAQCGAYLVSGGGPELAGVLHSYLHVEPCNYQASSAGAKLFFPHPGPVMGSSTWRQSDQ